MSIAGAKPALGHLGVILYGEAAVNDVRMDNGKSLFATLAAIDPRWAIVEYNTADLRDPKVQPTYAAGVPRPARLVEFRRALRVADGVERQQRRRSPASPATRRSPRGATRRSRRPRAISCSRAPDCRSARCCGRSARRAHADGDGWTAEVGAIALGNGRLSLTPDDNGRVVLLSPSGLPPSARDAEKFVLGLEADAGLRRVRVQARRAPEADGKRLRTRRERRCA